ncbi:MAG: porphobilinogen synthase [Sebaldella sp.]|nr:porphobilinogen synthase [Sebaldella sp.]
MFKRHRKLRINQNMRNLVKNVYLDVDDLIYPLFIIEGSGIREEIKSMPGIFRFSIDTLKQELDELKSLGIKTLLLFGIPNHKDSVATEAYNEHGVIQEAVRFIKKVYPDFLIVTDVCACEYTDHGHCGILDEHGYVVNDKSINLMADIALSHVKAGADIVAPSDMMDGRVSKIREVLDREGFVNTPIISYSVKFSSAFYGPFRDAADSTPQFGDRKSYQMDYRSEFDILSEVEEDLKQGADMIIVKPALAYLDIMAKVKREFDVPIVAYNVSGEYSMVKAAAQNGWIDEKSIVMEEMYAMKRAGASIIMTYFAKDVAKWLKEGK